MVTAAYTMKQKPIFFKPGHKIMELDIVLILPDLLIFLMGFCHFKQLLQKIAIVYNNVFLHIRQCGLRHLDICHKLSRFLIALSSIMSQEPPLDVACARPEIFGGLFAQEQ